MLRQLLQKWSNWTGDRHLQQAIHAELRRRKLAVHAAQIQAVRLVAIERPGWIQVRRFRVATLDAEKTPLMMLGLARDDARRSGIDVFMTRDADELRRQLDQWSEGMIRRG